MLGKNLADARARKGWSQAVLAEHAGVSVEWVRKVEQGVSNRPRMEMVLKVAEALGIPASELLVGQPESDGIQGIEYLPKEKVDSINASLRHMRRLPMKELRTLEMLIAAMAELSDDEFQN